MQSMVLYRIYQSGEKELFSRSGRGRGSIIYPSPHSASSLVETERYSLLWFSEKGCSRYSREDGGLLASKYRFTIYRGNVTNPFWSGG